MTDDTQLTEVHPIPIPAPPLEEWSGYPHPDAPDDYWIDDDTAEVVCATTGERFPPSHPIN